MNNWKEYKLGEIAVDISYGYTASADKKPIGPKFLRITDIREDSINWDTVPYCSINDKDYEKNKIEIGDIVVARTGATTGITEIIKHKIDAVFASYLIRFRINQNIAHPFYVGYVLKSKLWKDYVASIIGGSAQPGANAKQFADFPIAVPPLKTQATIAEILSSLDDKIELNNQINHKLEALAQTLFKHWFIDFEFPNENGEPYKSSGDEMEESELGEIPKGWRVDKLEKFISKSHTGGDAIKKTPIVDYDTGVRCARVSDLTNANPVDKWGYCKVTDSIFDQYQLLKGDIIVARTATLGVNQFINEDLFAVCNNGLIRLQFRELDNAYFIYQAMQNQRYKIYIDRISGDSSTRPNMKMQYLMDYPIIYPETSIIKEFNIILKPIIEKTRELENENSIITNMRDTLLPKLISGELEVSEILTEKAM